jgi:Family of unknown function (DUF6527)
VRLTDLNPKWEIEPATLETAIGVSFDCPAGCGSRHWVPFSKASGYATYWTREGDTFETLSLTPSIRFLGFPEGQPDHWHGFITKGGIITV